MRKIEPKPGIGPAKTYNARVDKMPQTIGYTNSYLMKKGPTQNRRRTDSGMKVETHHDPCGRSSNIMAQELSKIGPRKSTIGRWMMGYDRPKETMGEVTGRRPVEDGLVEVFHRGARAQVGPVAGSCGRRDNACIVRMGAGAPGLGFRSAPLSSSGTHKPKK